MICNYLKYFIFKREREIHKLNNNGLAKTLKRWEGKTPAISALSYGQYINHTNSYLITTCALKATNK